MKGEWALSRKIENAGVFQGRAVFEAMKPDTFRYLEEGNLRLDSGFVGWAFREYYYQLAGDQILVSFTDAPPGVRPFLRLRPHNDFTRSWAQDVHYCGTDKYECTYTFSSRDSFTTHIKVEGDTKNYSMSTTFIRASR